MSGKEGTQTEFFHTPNALHDAQKQIVIQRLPAPSDQRARGTPEATGLIADIQALIAGDKNRDSGSVPMPKGYLPDDVALFCRRISRTSANWKTADPAARVCVLKGQICRWPVQDVLRDALRHDEWAVTIDSIQKFVADYYQLKLVELKSRNNWKSRFPARSRCTSVSRSRTRRW